MKRFFYWLLGSIFLRLSSQYQEIETLPTPEKYKNSRWNFDAFQLSNGLKVLHVDTNHVGQCVVALDIKVGYSNCNVGGQEMPYLQSEIIHKTKIEELSDMSYIDYVELHNGGHSTSVDESHTSYVFAIKPEKFEETIVQFSRLFQSPSFTIEDIKKRSKETFDVFSQFVQKKNPELLRVLQDKAIRSHPFYNYMRINEEFVKNATVESVSAFFNKYYVANNMTLFVTSDKSTDEIKEIIAECFGSIPSKPIENSFIGEPIFKEGILGKISHVKSTCNSPYISINWAFPIQYDKLADLEVYLRILLRSEAKGSLQQLLIKDGFSTYLGIVTAQSNTFYLLTIEIHLTQKGLDQYKRVIQMFFSYLKFIQSNPIQIYLLEEELKIRKNRNYSNLFKPQNSETVRCDARALHWCPTRHFNYSELQFSTDNERIKEFINRFQPENSIVTLMTSREPPVGKDSEATAVCEVKYWTEDLNLDNIVDSSIQFLFPARNTVIPDNLKKKAPFNPLRSLDISPQPLYPTTLWLSPIDYLFENSERISILLARNDFFMKSVENYSLITLLVRFFQRQFSHEFYYYERSGFIATISIRNIGISFEFTGYKDKLKKFVLFFIKIFSDFVRSYKYSQIFRGDISSYKLIDSFSKLTTVEQVSKYLKKEFLVVPYLEEDISKVFDSISLRKMMNFVNDFISESYQLRVLVTGSFLEDETKLLHDGVFKILSRFIFKLNWEPLKGYQLIIEPKVVERRTYLNESSSSNVVNLYFQFPITEEDKKDIVFLHLYKKLFLTQFNKCFSKEDGISCAPDLLISTNRSFVGISFFVESKDFNCEEIEKRILKFIEDALELLRGIFKPVFQNGQLGEWVREMSPNDNFGERILASKIEDVKKDCQNQKTEKKNYHSKHWDFITEQEIELTKEEFEKIASGIKPGEFIGFVEEHLQLNGSERRLMVISITGGDNQA